VSAPNVPHDIAAEREKEGWLLGSSVVVVLGEPGEFHERAFLFAVLFCYITLS